MRNIQYCIVSLLPFDGILIAFLLALVCASACYAAYTLREMFSIPQLTVGYDFACQYAHDCCTVIMMEVIAEANCIFL